MVLYRHIPVYTAAAGAIPGIPAAIEGILGVTSAPYIAHAALVPPTGVCAAANCGKVVGYGQDAAFKWKGSLGARAVIRLAHSHCALGTRQIIISLTL